LKTLRSAVRPVVTLLLVIAIIALAFLWTLGIAPNEVPVWFVSAVSLVLGYWFGSRTAEKIKTD